MIKLGELFQEKGIKVEDFEKKEVNEKEIESNQEIEFYEKLLKLEERKASEKEKYHFAVEHGFLSYKHLMLYISSLDECSFLRDELELNEEFLSDKEIQHLEKELKEKEDLAKAIKNKSYYSMMMRISKEKDYSPYGENLLKSKFTEPDGVWNRGTY